MATYMLTLCQRLGGELPNRGSLFGREEFDTNCRRYGRTLSATEQVPLFTG